MTANALLRFQKEVCPEIPLNSPEITHRLIEEIAKLKQNEKSEFTSEHGGSVKG
ncbi:MAG: hypothetical protein KKC68_04335 [Candidatus Thermoplasmatota archaeon]|nr:hypothetical protein [Candidatus Thermoplasmatota archaeon]MBU1940979.1 hypothetical protein [Candidatus Thermoplasmatota archaeon]